MATAASIAAWSRSIRRDHARVLRLIGLQEDAARRQAAAECDAVAALALSERRHRALAEAGALALFLADASGRIRRVDGAWSELTGQPPGEVAGSDRYWVQALHPEDRAAAATAWLQAVATGEPYEAEYRLLAAAGGWRWCRARAVPIRDEPEPGHEAGRVLEWIGVVEDIDARRRAEAQRALLAREVDHRAKNLLAVVQAVVRMAGAGEASMAVVADRIAALARAHDLLARAEWRGAPLREVAEQELAPYHDPEGLPLAIIHGPEVMLAATATQPVAMLLHELATNAAKHGALARGDRVHLSWQVDGALLRLRWTETGGNGVAGAVPERRGFGSRVIDSTVRGQLGGTIERDWRPEGLDCRIALPLERLVPAESDAA